MGDLKYTWEKPVRDVTLAARAEVVHTMAGNWSSLVGSLRHRHDEFNQIWETWVRPYWSGPAADTAHQHWRKVAEDFRKVADNYGASGPTGSGLPGMLRDCANQINSTIGRIPIPLYENDQNPSLPGGQPDQFSGDALYHDYDTNRDAYEDGQFKQKALNASGTGHEGKHDGKVEAGSQTRTHDYHANTGDADKNHEAVAGLDKTTYAKYKALVDAWYTKNQKPANTAYESLITTYTTHGNSLPGPVLSRSSSPTATSPPKIITDPPPAPTADSLTGVPDVSGADSPAMDVGSTPGMQDSHTYPGVGAASNTGLDPSSGLTGVHSGLTGLPDTGSASYGAWPGATGGAAGDFGGVGGLPGVGSSIGVGSAPIDNGPGPVPTAIGHRSPVPSITAMAGRDASANTDAGAGMYGAGPGGAGRERDEAVSWLTEDQDVWGQYDQRDVAPPDGVI
jgi:hypothetical protein